MSEVFGSRDGTQMSRHLKSFTVMFIIIYVFVRPFFCYIFCMLLYAEIWQGHMTRILLNIFFFCCQG